MVKEERELLYEESKAISNSDIGLYLLGGPEYLERKRTSTRKRESYFDKGSAVHCYIFENTLFNDRYYIANNKINGKLGIFLEALVRLTLKEKVEDEVALAKAYGESGFQTTYDSVLKKFNSSPIQEVYKEMCEASNKTILSAEEYHDVKLMAEALYNHRGACQLLPERSPTFDTGTDILEFDELEIYWNFLIPAEASSSFDFPSFELDCKSKVDRLIIDKKAKKVKIIDLKTTSKPARTFLNAYRNYRYYRQIAYYNSAVKYYMQDVLNLNPEEYEFESYIVVVETTAPNCVKVYKPLELDIQYGIEEYTDVLMDIAWHVKNNVWKDRSEIEGTGIEPITLITFEQIELNNDDGNESS